MTGKQEQNLVSRNYNKQSVSVQEELGQLRLVRGVGKWSSLGKKVRISFGIGQNLLGRAKGHHSKI
ncbi:hypothetical protein [Kamptonema formosum]|uniref:hypothetical protein n=1 Tax=Kamptonema formosum TaxID=331992 RepID=UPI0003717ED7|nr:hypothetical protein [Oscillatoria sp. PCC 10802]